MSSNYKLIEELGLRIHRIESTSSHSFGAESSVEFVRADFLEELLNKGKKMYGKTNSDGFDSHDFADDRCISGTDTHEGLLINIQPIEKPNPVSKQDLQELKHEINKHMGENTWQVEIIERIEKYGIESAGVKA